ncbi:carboxypeptidase regulatory-like domain-containing protein [Anaerophilus nitritogenes]|uniref:carboxypeptidase regulatory-like domain-containing protein n=1 Tax=Anaerophilus nitritogenes TaxID=2498136 RepID=UPI00101C0472|nr:carboxypeptidase regulatory-like domain-containing protein [Anaerophilus nitritogenes]
MKKIYQLGLILMMMILYTSPTFAHGVDITYTKDSSYTIDAKYEDGMVMKNAQIIIYAPDDAKKPWKKDTCDENGKYVFTPDSSKEGDWMVQIRQSGHGGMLHIPVGAEESAPVQSGYSPVQKWIMAGCVVWGMIGTALYFSRRNQ